MARAKHDNRTKQIVVAALVVAIVLVGAIIVIKMSQQGEQNNSTPTETTIGETEQVDTSINETESEPVDQTPPEAEEDATNNTPELDPSTVATIDIEPMEVTVSYVKGAGGFEYEVLRTPRGTQYVEFRNEELSGTKCTDDAGTFVSIIENPQADERATLTETTAVEDTEYGLSLATDTCTNDSEKLEQYQKAFRDAFSLLKKME